MISITTTTAIWGGVLFIASGLALLGLLKVSVLDGLLKVCAALELRIKDLEKENKKMKADLSLLRNEGELTNRQLKVSLRVIEYFERLATVVIKGRPRVPADVAAAIDQALRDLAQFRKDAALDLESMEINRDHYDWLLARDAIMGPDRETATSS